jgi:hypothetical protein
MSRIDIIRAWDETRTAFFKRGTKMRSRTQRNMLTEFDEGLIKAVG